jgi:hypothetical protein
VSIPGMFSYIEFNIGWHYKKALLSHWAIIIQIKKTIWKKLLFEKIGDKIMKIGNSTANSSKRYRI